MTVPSGGSLPLANAHATVQLTDLLDIFNRATARGIQGSLGALAPALAGRGTATNTTIGALAQLLGPLHDLSATLSAPATRLPAFIDASDVLTAAVAPVSNALASAFANGGTTFDAIADHAPSLAATIETLPPAESAVAVAFTALDPGLGVSRRIAWRWPGAAIAGHAAVRQTRRWPTACRRFARYRASPACCSRR